MSQEDVINLASSAWAGLISKAVCHPIDTCKAKLQSGATFSGLSDLISKTIKTEGIKGFYRGLGAVLVGGVPGVVVYLTSYDACKKYLSKFSFAESNPFTSFFISGMVAEIVCCAVFLPVDVVKERLQVQSNRPETPYKGSVDALRTIIKQEGLKGLYKGYAATVFSYGPFSAVFFVLYEKMKKYTEERNKQTGKTDLDFGQNLLCSAVAGSVASLITNPLDVAKLRYQIQRRATVAGEEPYSGLVDALVKIYRAQGWRGLTRGALTRVAYHTPSTAITMASYDQFKGLLSSTLR